MPAGEKRKISCVHRLEAGIHKISWRVKVALGQVGVTRYYQRVEGHRVDQAILIRMQGAARFNVISSATDQGTNL